MSTIFHEDTTAQGTLIQVSTVYATQSSNPRGILISLGLGGDSSGTPAGIVTDLQITQQVATQFQQSLHQNVYAMSFGDAVGQMSVSLLLNTTCQGADRAAALLNYYSTNRISPTNSSPVQWQIGSSGFTGFVTGFQMSANSRDFMMMGQLHFAAWLDTAGGASVGGQS